MLLENRTLMQKKELSVADLHASGDQAKRQFSIVDLHAKPESGSYLSGGKVSHEIERLRASASTLGLKENNLGDPTND